MKAASSPPPGKSITKSYDIKGSTRHRLAPVEDSVGKDLNFDQEVGALDLDPEVAMELCDTHQADVEILRRYDIMDFSLLIQIHDAQGEIGQPITRGLKAETAPSD